jgi:membrane protease YdiL (CAAX protease family)
VAGRDGRHLPAAGWLGAAGRALAYGAAVWLLEPAVHTLLAPWTPAEPLSAMAWYTAGTLLTALVVGVVLLRLLDGRSPAALGFALSRQVPRELGIGAVAGIVPQFGAALLLVGAGGLAFGADQGSPWQWVGSVGRALLVLGIAAAAEEVVYRGYGFQALVRGFGRWPTLLLTSALFAIAHARNPAITPFALGNIFLAGVVLGLAYLRTLSLWLVTALHAGWNWSMASLLDLPVSGLILFDTPLYEPTLTAPRWLGGGEFGPEGGLVGTAALLAALLIATHWPGVRPSPAQLAARPLPAKREEPESDE